MVRFVWIKDVRGGYRPEKWPDDMPWNQNVPKAAEVHTVKPKEANLDIDALVKLYPPPLGGDYENKDGV
jgi:hypothetical protein